MWNCWNPDPKQRPSFSDLAYQVNELLCCAQVCYPFDYIIHKLHTETISGSSIVVCSLIHSFIIHSFVRWIIPFFCLSSFRCSIFPSFLPSLIPSILPFSYPSILPSFHPSIFPFSLHQSFLPSFLHSFIYSFLHSFIYSFLPSFLPSFFPSFLPSSLPSFSSFIHSFKEQWFDKCIYNVFLQTVYDPVPSQDNHAYDEVDIKNKLNEQDEDDAIKLDIMKMKKAEDKISMAWVICHQSKHRKQERSSSCYFACYGRLVTWYAGLGITGLGKAKWIIVKLFEITDQEYWNFGITDRRYRLKIWDTRAPAYCVTTLLWQLTCLSTPREWMVSISSLKL